MRVNIYLRDRMAAFVATESARLGLSEVEFIRKCIVDKMIAEKFNTVIETPPPPRREKPEKHYAEVPEPDDPREPTFLRMSRKDSNKIPEIAPWVSFIAPVKGGFHLWKHLSYYEGWQKENPYGEC